MQLMLLKRWVVGAPMPLAQARHERLTKRVALAVFSSDALSSVAYATEEILLVLVLAGAAAMAHLTLPIALAITALLVVVTISYQQTIHAYPSGGGSYIVARANLGSGPGLMAAAALLVDYVLTVAVSVAAGVAAITSAIPELATHKVALGVLCVAGIAMANIRGVRESGRIFAVPDVRLHREHLRRCSSWPGPTGSADAGRCRRRRRMPHRGDRGARPGSCCCAPSPSGCTAMTGTEAISNGIPAFKPARVAQRRASRSA